MADETKTLAVDTSPADGAADTNGAETTAENTAEPEEKAKGAFVRWLEDLFAGKGTDKADQPAAKTEPAAGQKTYTEAELQAALEAKQAEWDAARTKAAELDNMDPAARAKAELDAKEAELAEARAQLLRKDLKDEAIKTLSEDGYPAALADMVDYTSKDAMQRSLQQVQATFKDSLAAAINERLRGKTPAGLGGAAKNENALRDEIAQHIRGGLM